MQKCLNCGKDFMDGVKSCPYCETKVAQKVEKVKKLPAAYKVMLINKRYDDHNGYVPTVIILIALFAPIFIGVIGLLLAAVVLFIGWAMAAKNADVRAECIAELEELGEEEADGTEVA